MTKVIMDGVEIDQDLLQDKVKFIKFIKCLSASMIVNKVVDKPYDFDNVELISSNYNCTVNPKKQLDLMFAYDDQYETDDDSDIGGRNNGVLYIGKFNDGIVKPFKNQDK